MGRKRDRLTSFDVHVLFKFKHAFDHESDPDGPNHPNLRLCPQCQRARAADSGDKPRGNPDSAWWAKLGCEEYERLAEAQDYLDSVESIRLGLKAVEDGDVRPAEDVVADWETL